MTPSAKRRASRILLWVLLALCFLGVGPHDILHDHGLGEGGDDCQLCGLSLLDVAAPAFEARFIVERQAAILRSEERPLDRTRVSADPRAPPA